MSDLADQINNKWMSGKPSTRLLMICVLLSLAIILIYSQVVSFDFINLDDPAYIKDNPVVNQGITIKGLIWAFTSVGYAANWHPITWISHMLDVWFFGMNSGMHHLTNVLFHILNTILLFLIFERMTGELWKSAAVAALFALHPQHVESVAWIAERKDVLSTFFWMLTMIGYVWYLEHKSIMRYLVVIFLFILGLLSKPMLVTLPFLLLILDIWPLKRWSPFQKPCIKNQGKDYKNISKEQTDLKSLILEKIPLIFIAVISSYLTLLAQNRGGAVNTLGDVQLNIRVFNALTSYTFYLKKIFWPFNLSFFYPYPDSFNAVGIALSSLVILLITALVIIAAKKLPYLFMGWFWYIGTLIPVIGIAQVGIQSMADRYSYIPTIGIFLALVWGLYDLCKKYSYGKVTLRITVLIVLVIFMITASAQISSWKNSITLTSHALKVTKDNFLAHYLLGLALFNNNDVAGSIREYRKSLEIKPYYISAHYWLGIALAQEKKYDEAAAHYQECIKVNPDSEMAYNGLGDIMLNLGDYNEAIKNYTISIKIRPDQEKVYNQLGSAYYFKKNMRKAVEYYENAVRLNPEYNMAIDNLNTAKAALSDIDKTISNLNDLIKNRKDDPAPYLILAEIYRQQGEYSSAITHYQQVLLIQPKSFKATLGLVLVYSDQQDYPKALDQLKIIQQIQPDDPGICYNIACIYAKQNKSEDSIHWIKQAIDKGFKDWGLIKNDPDLINIRNTTYMVDLLKGH